MAMIFLLAPFLVLLFIIVNRRRIFPVSSAASKLLPPSPPRLPIIGHLHRLGSHPHRALQGLSKKHGDIMLLYLGSRPAIVVSSAETASEVLRKQDLALSSRPKLRVITRLLSNGKDIVASPSGEHWRRMRSVWMQAIRKVGFLDRVRQEEVALMVGRFREAATAVNLSQELMTLTNDVVCRLAFGRTYRGEFTKVLDELLELIGGFYVADFMTWLGWIGRINGVDARVSRVAATLDGFLETILQEHSTNRSDEQVDFVDVLLEFSSQTDAALDRESLKGLILDLFAGGTVTTAVLLEWTMSELLRNPRVMNELKKEVTGIVGEDINVAITPRDIDKMEYLKAVIKECFRLHPPIPLLLPHESTAETTIKGYNVPAGSFVLVNAWSISRDPLYWEEPERFYPERFLGSPVDFKGQDFRLIPFGSGRRMCPGIGFAVPNIELVVANLVHRFKWRLPDHEHGPQDLDMSESPGLAVHRKNPLIVIPS